MALGQEELNFLIDEITDKIRREITFANRTETLDEVLIKYNFNKDETVSGSLPINQFGKIAIVGSANINKDDLFNLLSRFINNMKRIEIEDEYEKLKHFNFAKFKNSTNYSAILIGPNPHSTSGAEGYSSAIANMEANPQNYPKVIKLMKSTGELNISKSSVKYAMGELKREGII